MTSHAQTMYTCPCNLKFVYVSMSTYEAHKITCSHYKLSTWWDANFHHLLF